MNARSSISKENDLRARELSMIAIALSSSSECGYQGWWHLPLRETVV
jgi:hypothetical protein